MILSYNVQLKSLLKLPLGPDQFNSVLISFPGPVPVKLVNGSSMCSGRVEVYHNSIWRTVCDNSWNINAANVVCRLLNCGTALSVERDASYGEGTGSIWWYNVSCDGNEPNLDQCSINSRAGTNCTHSQDAGVFCSGPVPIRLVNGSNMCSGRVEVYRNSSWGTVCANGWDLNEANVVCRVLNCGTALSGTQNTTYGEGTGDIWLKDVSCDGSEISLDQCSANSQVGNSCKHSEDIGVTCSGPGPVRLANGSNMCSGRVEIYRNGVWGTVCDNGWDVKAANVVCSVLSCGKAMSADRSVSYGEGTGVIWSYNVSCNGTEPTLDQCSVNPVIRNNCTHAEDAGVTCSGPVSVRLVNGNNVCSGRVELYRNSKWGTICDNGWDVHSAKVVCRMLNCGTALAATRGAYFGEGTGDIWLDNVRCKGTELALYQCSANPLVGTNCTQKEEAGVICSGPVPIRLANGSTMCSGRVELYRNGAWGTVCDNGWDVKAANVVCSALNCGKALFADRSVSYGEGTGVIWSYNVSCDGTEPTLDQCSVNPVIRNNCTHAEDAGVTCSGSVRTRNRKTCLTPEGVLKKNKIYLSIRTYVSFAPFREPTLGISGKQEILALPFNACRDGGVRWEGSEVMSPIASSPFPSGIDFDQKRVGGTVEYSMTGGFLCASDRKVIETLKEAINSILSSIPRSRIMKEEVNRKTKCRLKD
ncbi:hypothetical protein scyTo_0016777 [Scyliorhinus torazame]|uniref:Soluble scavenger receptor cysteine-rich domain-containing protein SSC5D n=1 Tax=Scyliorhinus torazame TaxID=75743 RepID=A0A401PYB6_SCYTO|nr:hypothetical protein [Scyliorhinus torazame]